MRPGAWTFWSLLPLGGPEIVLGSLHFLFWDLFWYQVSIIEASVCRLSVLAFARSGIRHQHFLPCFAFLSFYFFIWKMRAMLLLNIYIVLPGTWHGPGAQWVFAFITNSQCHVLWGLLHPELTGLWRAKKRMRDCPKNMKLVSYLYMPLFFGHEAPNTNQMINEVHAPLGYRIIVLGTLVAELGPWQADKPGK